MEWSKNFFTSQGREKASLFLWYDFTWTPGTYNPITRIITERPCTSVSWMDHWTTNTENWILVLNPPEITGSCMTVNHSPPLSGSYVPHVKNKRMHWPRGTFFNLYSSRAFLRTLFTGWLTTTGGAKTTMDNKKLLLIQILSAGTCTLSSWKGGVIFQTNRKQPDGASRTKLPGWNVSSVPTLLCIPTENLTLSSLVSVGLENKFLHAPRMFPKYVLISDSVK